MAYRHIASSLSTSSTGGGSNSTASSCNGTNTSTNNPNSSSCGVGSEPFQHQRLEKILPGAYERLKNCDIKFSLDVHDSSDDNFRSAKMLATILGSSSSSSLPHGNLSNSDEQLPSVLFASGNSAESALLSTLSGPYNLPQISYAARSSDLDNRENHPLFARTVPSGETEAEALVQYLYSIEVKRFGVLYVADPFGISLYYGVVKAAEALDSEMKVWSFPYRHGEEETIEAAVDQ